MEWEDDEYLPEKIIIKLKNRFVDMKNPMKRGWKIEAVDLMDPKLICPTTIIVMKNCVVF